LTFVLINQDQSKLQGDGVHLQPLRFWQMMTPGKVELVRGSRLPLLPGSGKETCNYAAGKTLGLDSRRRERTQVIKYIVVGAGGFLGTIARFWLGSLIHDRMGSRFPYGTFIINCTGCFALGMIMVMLTRTDMHPYLRLSIPIGFIGGFTTFSAFEYETLMAVREGSLSMGLLNIGLSVVAGFVCVWLGLEFGKAVA
jgi:CrcB protein